MAVFAYDSVVTYNERGNGEQFNRGDVDTSPGTLDAGDGVFTVNEIIPGVGTYIGYYEQGAEKYPVVDIGGGQLQVFAPTGAPPATEDPFGLNQDLERLELDVCFAKGTLIATPNGETCVEDLRIGDLVRTSGGLAIPVKWVGRKTVHKLFRHPDQFAPVRVTAGALGSGLPHTDLVLTADHALVLHGLAINAGALVNGTTIIFDDVASLPERITYYHVETEGHEVILANGAAAETYIDYVQRRAFDNYQEYLDLYGEERTIQEMDLPRVSAARLVPSHIRAQLSPASAA